MTVQDVPPAPWVRSPSTRLRAGTPRARLAWRGLVIGLALSATSGCAVAISTASCEGRANNVHRSAGTPSDMVAKSTGTCTAPVSVSGFVEIQRKNSSGDWYLWKRTYVPTFIATPGVRFTRQAATQCARGTFRNKTYVQATYKGETKRTTNYSGTTTNPCG